MTEIAPSINLDISEKLKDPEYRRKFFLAESSAFIAAQIIALRKRRGLNQMQLAEGAHMRQPAISRVERADYQNWSFNTLRRLAEAMDARLRVIIEPSEDILNEYEQQPSAVVGAYDVTTVTNESRKEAERAAEQGRRPVSVLQPAQGSAATASSAEMQPGPIIGHDFENRYRPKERENRPLYKPVISATVA